MTFGLQGHLDYRHLDYHRLDYFGLQGRLDYKDIWTTNTNRLKIFTPLGPTEIVCYDHVGLFANTCIHALLAGNEEGISN